MTKSNYTVIIGKVLMEWLDEEGWDVDSVSTVRAKDGWYESIFDLVCDDGSLVEFIMRLTQPKLDANMRGRHNSFATPGDNLRAFIRAELERQCDE